MSQSYLYTTIELLKQVGVESSIQQAQGVIQSVTILEQNFQPCKYRVESDWSSAAFIYELVALSDKAEVDLPNPSLKSLQGDAVIANYMAKLGVITEEVDGKIILSKNAINLPDSIEFDLRSTPDLTQPLICTCFGLGIKVKVDGISHLQYKETNRLIALKNELENLGATANLTDDTIEVLPSTASLARFKPIHTYNDHRMVMAFAPLALKLGPLVIENPEAVTKSFPDFFENIFCIVD